MIQRAALLHPELPAISCEDRTLRAGEVYERAVRLGNALTGLGLKRGDRVAVVLPNCVENMEIEFGCAIAGIVRVSLNIRLPADELLRIMQAMGASALIYESRFAALAERFADTPECRGALRLALDGEDSEPAGAFAADYETLLAQASTRAPEMPVPADQLYCLFSTSGTTGLPKGVMLSHRALLAVAANLLIEYGPVRPGDGILLPQPLSHGAGFFMLPYFLSGGHCIVVRSFGVDAYETAARWNAATLKLVPTMLIDLLKAGVAPSADYAPRRIIYGAAPMPHQWLQRGLEVFGPVFAQLYGQAEAPMCITVLPEEDHRDERLIGSAGRPYRTVDVRVVDEEGRDVRPGDHGEVIVRGAHTMDGYWKDPGQSAEVMRDGYIRTRDNAVVDERGYVFLLGRRDEMINSGGFNIAPRVVERALHSHPDIAEAAVVGVAHERWGEAVKAYVVLAPGAKITPQDIIEYCRPLLGLQRPQEVELIPQLPKNAYGKVDKAELKAS